MQVVTILSDLKSLSVCQHEAALKMVTVHKTTSETLSSSVQEPSISERATNADLQRAKELVSLHYGVKVRFLESGLDVDLLQARWDVDHVLRALESESKNKTAE